MSWFDGIDYPLTVETIPVQKQEQKQEPRWVVHGTNSAGLEVLSYNTTRNYARVIYRQRKSCNWQNVWIEDRKTGKKVR